jgi:hypothetical protein
LTAPLQLILSRAGYECLVAKFRNSSILEEAKACRPLLFWTTESAKETPTLIGNERAWPPVDNASRKSRSVENAKISGLYTLRARSAKRTRGSGRRGGQTRFDRGTSCFFRRTTVCFHALPCFDQLGYLPASRQWSSREPK